MITIQEALDIISNQNTEMKTELRSLSDSLGYSLAEDIIAPFDIPAFDNSAMDGYALCGISKNYTIVGEVAAGDLDKVNLNPGEAARIFTGAKVPENTTAVVMQEKTIVKGENLILETEPSTGQCIRRKGDELKNGQVVFKENHRITPASVGLIGSLGIEKVSVFSKPVINLITTGNELVEIGKDRLDGQIYESNSFALSAACTQFGFLCKTRNHIEDNFDAIKAEIEKILKDSDVLLICGGISVGDYDFVKKALEENGVEELFYKVFQKPGKPLYYGKKENKYVFALPGNPASSLSCFYIYVLPLLQKLSGMESPGLMKLSLPLSHNFENNSDKPSFLKAKIYNYEVEILNAQSSSMLHSMAVGNALAFIEADSIMIKGDLLDCYLIH
ncbi:molybdopterin molybdotransferase MoeA [Marinigracilibium pacificum]|uniref:Molybdopterin molybdenumtransferase n=1 Tax=Marinigracilibium pacificum TaxID=2729599 RepID=A0A848IXB9_9BACT|nr:gephyrin-like molybdotransferase Glp [Marinigracilibium pacificum]NMM48296.1 molybdopterin molybdotransferase MoeA [Marinigracilibium pacificum]